MLQISQVFKSRRRGYAAKKASKDDPKQLEGAYSKGDYAEERIYEPQGTNN